MRHFFEHSKRSVAKTITYRLLIIISTYLIVYSLTGNTTTSNIVTGTATVVNTTIYFIHERIWNIIHWGKTSAKKR